MLAATIKKESSMSEQIIPSVVISRAYRNSGIITREESESLPGLDVRQLPEGVVAGLVRAESRVTLNLGNYESVQIGVSVTLPAVVEEVVDAYDAAQAFVEKKLAEQKAVIDEYRKNK
jgi:hypothetical protein